MAAEPSAAELRIRAATIGEPERLVGLIELAPYDATWPAQYEREAARVRADARRAGAARRARRLDLGPGVSAKPIIDMLLVVADSSDEQSYVPPMEQPGYTLRIREPDWYEHRLFKGPGANINLHVFSAGCPGDRPDDRLPRPSARRRRGSRAVSADQAGACGAQWNYVQEYADAKTQVIEAIIARARSATPQQ